MIRSLVSVEVDGIKYDNSDRYFEIINLGVKFSGNRK